MQSPFSAENSSKRLNVSPGKDDVKAAVDDDEIYSDAAAGDLEGEDGMDTAAYWEEGPGECQLTTFQKRWRSRMHVNGVAVYVESSAAEEGETKMVSVPVRCTPETCFRALMRHGFREWQVLEQRDSNNTVMYHQQNPLGGWLAARRDCVMLRTWRKDQDGSYMILLQDTEHDAAPPPAPALLGGTIRAHVRAAGFIIAPCAPEYTSAGRSTECLVTVMAKIDLGGWLSPDCWVGRWLASSSLDGSTTSAWVGPLVNKVITLRDLVEQNRFMRKPFEDAFVPVASSPHATDDVDPEQSQLDRMRSVAMRTHSFAPAAPMGSMSSLAGATASASGRDGAEGSVGTPLDGSLVTEEQLPWVMGTLPKANWSALSSQGFKVRGPAYLKDRKKIPAAEPIFTLASVDVVRLQKPTFHIARHLPSVRLSSAPFTFVVNIMVPSKPLMSLVVAWAATDFTPELLEQSAPGSSPSNTLHSSSSGAVLSNLGSVVDDEADSDQDAATDSQHRLTPFDLGIARFLAGSDADRDGKFKLIPRIAEGSWVIKQSVGTTPVILGRKLKSSYHRGPKYMEVDIDIGSSSVAASVVNLVYGATKSLVIDMAVLIEGQQEDELPEQLLGAVRLDHMDLNCAPWLDTERNVVSATPLQ